MSADMKPIHPGEVLLEVYMKPPIPGLTVEMLSQSLRVSEELLTSLINQNRSITPSLARQLSVVCHTTPEYWLKLQRAYNRQIAKHNSARRDHGNGTLIDYPAAAA